MVTDGDHNYFIVCGSLVLACMQTNLIIYQMLSNPFTKDARMYEGIRTDHDDHNLINFSETILGR